MPPKTKVKPLPYNYIDKPITSDDILKALDHKYNRSEQKRQWVGFAEFRPGTGYDKDANRYIDFWAMNCFEGQGFNKVSYEIKVSRSDFMTEIKNAEKRKMALLISNRYYFAAPMGLIQAADLPPEAGLVEFYWTHNQKDIEDVEMALQGIERVKRGEQTASDLMKQYPTIFRNYYRLEQIIKGATYYSLTVPEYKETLQSNVIVSAPYREHMMPGWKFAAALTRRVRDTIDDLNKDKVEQYD